MLQLRRLAEVNPSTPAFDRLSADAEVTFQPLETVWADDRADRTRISVKADVATGYVRFQDDDVLLPKTAPTFQHARTMLVRRAVNGVGAGSSELHILRAKPGVDPQFIAYVVRSGPFIRMGVSTYQGVAGLQRVPADFVAEWPVLPLRFGEQRRIAKFLDAQVGLLDRAIDLRRRQEALVKSMMWSWFDTVVDASTASPTSLNRYLSFTADGPFGSAFSSSDYTAGGPAVIRLGNISFAQFRGDDLARVPVEIWQRFPRCQVQPGDLLIASLGDANNHAGRACLAPDDLGPAIVKGKCFRARVDTTAADPTFLALAMSSPRGAELFSLETRGATRSMINLDILGAAGNCSGGSEDGQPGVAVGQAA